MHICPVCESPSVDLAIRKIQQRIEDLGGPGTDAGELALNELQDYVTGLECYKPDSWAEEWLGDDRVVVSWFCVNKCMTWQMDIGENVDLEKD